MKMCMRDRPAGEGAPAVEVKLSAGESQGRLYVEWVDVERLIGCWRRIAQRVPTIFVPLALPNKADTSADEVDHRLGLWILPDLPLKDGDRIIQGNGGRWWVQGAPLIGPARTHIVVLGERVGRGTRSLRRECAGER